jgi:hypothetical protein
MDLREILDGVVATGPDHWHLVNGLPVPAPVQFAVTSTGDDDATITGVREHYYGAVLKRDPALSLAWGMDIHNDLTFEFAKRVSYQMISSCSADILLSGSVIHRETYLTVDRGRAYLPLPKAITSDLELGTPELIAEQITEWEDQFLRLVNELTGLHEYDAYRQRLGFHVVRGHPLD